MHKGAIINNNTKEKINIGIPIGIIINKISYIKCTYEISDYNYTQIINNTDGSEINKEIESKIKILNNGKEEKLVFKKKFNKIGINTIYFEIEGKLNNMSFLFNNCLSLKEINFISFKTDDANNMKAMFQSCQKLENLDLSNFNTSKVTNMACMFNNCIKLKQIKGIDNFNTIKVTNMKEMFQSCNELEYLDLSNFNISNVIDKELIFSGCNKLKQIKGGEKFNTSKKNIKNETSASLTFDKNIINSYYYKPYKTIFSFGLKNNYQNESKSPSNNEKEIEHQKYRLKNNYQNESKSPSNNEKEIENQKRRSENNYLNESKRSSNNEEEIEPPKCRFCNRSIDDDEVTYHNSACVFCYYDDDS